MVLVGDPNLNHCQWVGGRSRIFPKFDGRNVSSVAIAIKVCMKKQIPFRDAASYSYTILLSL